MSKVYVLGAGAAAAYKGSFIGETSPVANNFFQKAMQVIDIHQIRNRRFSDDRLTYDHIFSFIEQFWGVPREKVANSNLDMEEVLTLLSIELEEDLPGRERLKLAYEEYLLLMALTFDKILFGEVCPHHRRIAQSLKPGDTVISFNYELLMDYALGNLTQDDQAKWQINDGYGVPCSKLTKAKGYAPNPVSNVKLLKLHGSLNWLFCPLCGQLYSYEHLDQRGNSIIINGMANMVECTSEKCCQRLSRVIIPPTLLKNYQIIPFIPKLWQQARECLQRAKEVVVIGYSFPTTDFRSNWMFRKAMVHNEGLEKLVIIDAAKGSQLDILLNKHKSIFRKEQLEFYNNISDYTESLEMPVFDIRDH